MTLVDQDDRQRAMTDFGSILLVEAAAGTGKTALMAGRIAMMLASGHMPADIAAITFTELAGEPACPSHPGDRRCASGGRRSGFHRPVLPKGLKVEQRAALEAAAPRLDELTATTIHGFCQAIIQSHGVQAGVDPAPVLPMSMSLERFSRRVRNVVLPPARRRRRR